MSSLSERRREDERGSALVDDGPRDRDDDGRGEHGAAGRYFVVIGTDMARRVCGSLQSAGHRVCHLGRPTDQELRAALDGEVAGVAILLDDDVESLRYALTTEHIRPNVPLVVTVFDRTVAEQLSRVVPNCRVTSPAEVAAPVLLAACLQPDLLALIPAYSRPAPDSDSDPAPCHLGARAEGDTVRLEPYRAPRSLRARAWFGKIRGQLRPHDGSSRIMLTGLAGILAVLLADWTWSVALRHRAPVEALFEAARTVATVGPAGTHGSDAYLVFSALAMLVTVVFTAVFTAGMVDRLLAPRSVGILGPRALPRGGHVVVVGLGQVGLRLCTELQGLGVGVIAVERDPAAPNLRLAKALGVPVVVADATDRFVLRRLGLHQAQAMAAVASDDRDNIAVSIASLAVAPELRLVMRAGDHDAIAETRSLFRIGPVHDLNTLSAAYTTATLSGLRPRTVLAHGRQLLLERPDGTFAPWPHSDRCTHPQDPDHTPSRETAASPAR
ncbi:NAD-binding protein [Streptomyces sp. WMMB 322]|uniref:NAD-binding protein n=1 Tax=Streptomyces sp. WMMB 322 TaxID=1286821 RepID=UPI0020C75C34|nr:NAD-binding protein [Streptomyces sp. WMMB 322]